MELLNLMYQYINKFINSDELLTELNKINLSELTKEEEKNINQLILDIKEIKKDIPNEIDEEEKQRIRQIDYLLDLIEKSISSEKIDKKIKEFAEGQYDNLIKARKKVNDGGQLYTEICNLFKDNSLMDNYIKQMTDVELLNFITQYISVPKPIKITEKKFTDLVNAGIKEDKRESLWRLAFNYEGQGMNYANIEDYFIKKGDAYYLTELMYAVTSDLDFKELKKKVLASNDESLLNEYLETAKELDIDK